MAWLCVLSLPGMMQVGTLIEFKSFSLAPMIGSSAPLANCARQRSMAAMNVFGSMAINTARFCGRASMRSLKCSRSHTAAMPPSRAAWMYLP